MKTQDLSISVVTIDGGSGTGTTTISTKVAALLGHHKLNSGLFYRGLGILYEHHGYNKCDIDTIVSLAKILPITFSGEKIFLENKDVTQFIKSDEAGALGSKVARFPQVREVFKQKFLAMRQAPGLVADGRDMGTVFDTPYRFFITTAPEESARRRVAQFKHMGIEKSYEDVLRDIISRDESDKNNPANPLRPHSDAKIIDNTHLKADDVVEIIIDTYCAHA